MEFMAKIPWKIPWYVEFQKRIYVLLPLVDLWYAKKNIFAEFLHGVLYNIMSAIQSIPMYSQERILFCLGLTTICESKEITKMYLDVLLYFLTDALSNFTYL